MERVPRSGELYQHFKGNLYQVIAVARHSETGEELVIYQALYGDYQVYARPLAMFVSEVDRVKYPQVTQRYRFERIERKTLDGRKAADNIAEAQMPHVAGTQAEAMAKYMKGMQAEEMAESSSEVSAKLMDFFDAQDLGEKYNILVSMRDEVDDHMINNMAVVLDVVIPEGDTSERYEQLKRCIRTKQRYETERLR